MKGTIVYKFSCRNFPAGASFGVVIGREDFSFPDGKGGFTPPMDCYVVASIPTTEEKKNKAIAHHAIEQVHSDEQLLQGPTIKILSQDKNYLYLVNLSPEERVEKILEIINS